MKEIHFCLHCTKKFLEYKSNKRKFCSKVCSGKHKDKTIHSLETRKKIRLKHLGRPKSEIYKRQVSGENCWNWKGGVTPLNTAIYNLPEYQNWRIEVFTRDGCICQECFKPESKVLKIEAHHIKPFSNLLQEFLKHYNQFSPLEDKEILVRLAINWIPFWDLTNGQTLCFDCHKQKTKEHLKVMGCRDSKINPETKHE